ncbi:MAG TPA: PhoU domain-containing protein [Planctomycetota bacterium]|nr:PhoU domain-containing protein [Planctomycetota bacterium]
MGGMVEEATRNATVALTQRRADLARRVIESVAERAIDLSARDPLVLPLRFERMTEIVRAMLHDALDALVHRKAQLARRVLEQDPEINEIHKEHFGLLQDTMKASPDSVEAAVDLLSASRQIERIGDQTKNIAEDVVFLIEGQVIRHQRTPPAARSAWGAP